MESAFKLYLKNGLTDVSNSELKKEANITSGGFYHYFPSKDDLLNETVDMFIFRYNNLVLDEISDCKGSPHELLKIVASAMMGHGENSQKVTILSDGTRIDYKQLHLLLLEGVKKFDKIHDQYRDLLIKLMDLIVKIIEDGKAQGTIKEDIDAYEMAIYIQSVINGTLNLWIVLDDFNLEEKMDYAMDCIWDSISI